MHTLFGRSSGKSSGLVVEPNPVSNEDALSVIAKVTSILHTTENLAANRPTKENTEAVDVLRTYLDKLRTFASLNKPTSKIPESDLPTLSTTKSSSFKG